MDVTLQGWLKLKLDLDRNHWGENFPILWKRVLKEMAHKYPNIMHLVQIVLVLPVATSQVERQFRTIKIILGDWRLKQLKLYCIYVARDQSIQNLTQNPV